MISDGGKKILQRLSEAIKSINTISTVHKNPIE